MVRLADALPWPKPWIEVDCPNNGELRLPTGASRLTRLSRLRAAIEKVTVYLRSLEEVSGP